MDALESVGPDHQGLRRSIAGDSAVRLWEVERLEEVSEKVIGEQWHTIGEQVHFVCNVVCNVV